MNSLQIIMLGPSLDVKGGISTAEKLILQHAPPEVKFHHISTLEEGTVAHKVVVFGQAIGELLWSLLREDVKLVHIHFASRGSTLRKAILTLLVWMFRKPIILHANGAEFHLFYSEELPQWGRRLLSWVLRRCASFIAVSDSWKNFYTTSLGLKAEKVFVLPNPVKLPSRIPPRTDSNKVNFLFLGRIGHRKGAFDLIKAFAQLPADCRIRASLTMAGDGEVEQARNLVKSLNLMNQIAILSWVDSEQRDALLAKADVFILPSYNEGLSLALLEAMGWGLPVITTPVGGTPELVTPNQDGLLVNPGKVEQLSEAMQFLIENEDMRLSIGANARKCVEPLDIKKYWVALLEVYRSTVKLDETKELVATSTSIHQDRHK